MLNNVYRRVTTGWIESEPMTRPFLSLILLPLICSGIVNAKPLRPRHTPYRTSVPDLSLLAPKAISLPRSQWPLHPGQSLRLSYPLPIVASEVSPFGWRFSMHRNQWRMHAGYDLITAMGTPVLAMLTGQVMMVQPVKGYGLTVLLDHGNGWQTLYAHLLDTRIRPGQLIPTGTPIGRVGQSGQASVAHLHCELRRVEGNDAYALDPSPLLQSANSPYSNRRMPKIVNRI